MKQETATPADRPRVQLKMYAPALLLAMFICALHAGISLASRLLAVAPPLGKAYPGGRPTDILVLLAAISVFFVAHIAETSMWAAFFWKSGHFGGSFADGWYFAAVSNTTLGYGDVVLSNRGGVSGRCVR